MQSDPSPFGIRGFLIDAPEYGSLRTRRDGAIIVENGRIGEIGDYDDLRRGKRAVPVCWTDRGGARALGKSATIGSLDVGKEADLIVVDLAALLPYGKEGRGFDDLSTEDILALCIYRGGPRANLETYVRGKCVYRAPELAARV
jgi:cytosine/adenosine deaminase-related metal-dependent hydrolase